VTSRTDTTSLRLRRGGALCSAAAKAAGVRTNRPPPTVDMDCCRKSAKPEDSNQIDAIQIQIMNTKNYERKLIWMDMDSDTGLLVLRLKMISFYREAFHTSFCRFYDKKSKGCQDLSWLHPWI
jgi:hypothetical protein